MTRKYLFKFASILLTFSLLFFPASLLYADTIKIGLRAHHGIEKSMQQWKPTADYLSEKIPEHKFIMIPLVELSELMHEAEQNRFDFVLTNPSSYVEMEIRLGASAILTLRNKRQDEPYSSFGAVIFTRKNNPAINNIADLKDKKIVAVSERAFGGWRVAVRELLTEGFDIYKEAKQISFSGGIQQDVVSIVQLGNADAGVVRTDMLERMASEGLIKLDDFKIINKKENKDFPFFHSTRLYPEWPFVKMRNTSTVLAKKVALALLTIPADHPAAVAGKYVGWTVPEDYQPVHELMQDLKVGPYLHYHENPVEHFFETYLIPFVISIFVVAAIIFIAIYILTINRKLIRVKAEQDKIMDELEERVAARTRDLLIAKEEAEKASNSKSEFLSSMSHELRTPLNAVLGFAQLLEMDAKLNKLPSAEENIKEILHAGAYLLELINDVLDLANIETGKYDLDIKPVSMTKVTNDTLRLMQTQAKEKKITITEEVDDGETLDVYADPRSLKHVLINLISNAIKYNHPGGRVDITIEKQPAGYCTVSVSDTGDGIAEESLKFIFDPFQRVTKRTNIEGAGVGLAITKSLVEMMDGNIAVQSSPGQGSVFSVSFKLVA